MIYNYISNTAWNRTHNLLRPKCGLIPLGHSDGLTVIVVVGIELMHYFDAYVLNFNGIPSVLIFVFLIESKDIFLVERLFSSSLLAVVSFSNPTKLMIFHYKKEKEICTYTYTSNILAVRLNRLVSLYSLYCRPAVGMSCLLN